jgi:outer membrane lipoprotein SlyB
VRILLIVLSLAMLPVGFAAAQGQPFVYPAKGQSQDQQDIDTAQCNRWAQSQAPNRPSGPDRGARAAGTVGGAAKGAAVGSAVGAIAGGKAGKGAAAGAVVGGVGGRQGAVAREQQAQAGARNDYARAFGACMEARGYSVR